jgi:hypothetical protein
MPQNQQVEGSNVQHWIELGMGLIAAVALVAGGREGLRLWRDWRGSGV